MKGVYPVLFVKSYRQTVSLPAYYFKYDMYGRSKIFLSFTFSFV